MGGQLILGEIVCLCVGDDFIEANVEQFIANNFSISQMFYMLIDPKLKLVHAAEMRKLSFYRMKVSIE